jgi:hypothetical protein
MRKLVAVVLLGAVLVMGSPFAAHAGGAGSAALALGAFAAFSVLTAPFWAPAYYPAYGYARPAYYAPPAYYAAAPVTYATAPAPPPAIQREVVYAHGRHVLLGDGVSTAYQWVWVPNPPPPPPAAWPAPPKS